MIEVDWVPTGELGSPSRNARMTRMKSLAIAGRRGEKMREVAGVLLCLLGETIAWMPSPPTFLGASVTSASSYKDFSARTAVRTSAAKLQMNFLGFDFSELAAFGNLIVQCEGIDTL